MYQKILVVGPIVLGPTIVGCNMDYSTYAVWSNSCRSHHSGLEFDSMGVLGQATQSQGKKTLQNSGTLRV